MIIFKFIVEISGVSYSKVADFSKISPLYRNSRIVPISDHNFHIAIQKNSEKPLEITKKEAEQEANSLVDKLSFVDNHWVKSINYLGYFDRTGSFNPERKHYNMKAQGLAIIGDPTSFFSNPRNKKIFNTKSNLGAMRTFRMAMAIKDDTSRYLILYGILLILKGGKSENQAMVDQFILSKYPNILMVDGKHKRETVITKIRNQVAHPIQELNIDDLISDTSTYLLLIENLVKEACIGE